MTHTHSQFKLHEDPLALVLCQVRFSRIRKMPEFLPEIQDRLRNVGFPEDASAPLQRIHLEPGKPPALSSVRHEEFRSKDEAWGVVIAEDMLVLATTHYDRYIGFAERLKAAVTIVDEVAGLQQGSITRVGLRYIDAIIPGPGESWRHYLQPSLHGPASPVFEGGEPLLGMEFHGRTEAGRLAIRITQNNQGQLVPPGTLVKPMAFRQKDLGSQLLTLIDSDHYVEGQWDFSMSELLDTVDALHKGINTVFFNNIVSEHALTAWGAEHVADA
jgi:uncharacterized protein (TIGR04255 family)